MDRFTRFSAIIAFGILVLAVDSPRRADSGAYFTRLETDGSSVLREVVLER